MQQHNQGSTNMSLDNAKTPPGFAAAQAKSRKMEAAAIAKRKMKAVSNAASRLMGGLYSK